MRISILRTPPVVTFLRPVPFPFPLFRGGNGNGNEGNRLGNGMFTRSFPRNGWEQVGWPGWTLGRHHHGPRLVGGVS